MKAVDTEKCRDEIDEMDGAPILEGHMCAYAGFATGGCYVSYYIHKKSQYYEYYFNRKYCIG